MAQGLANPDDSDLTNRWMALFRMDTLTKQQREKLSWTESMPNRYLLRKNLPGAILWLCVRERVRE